MITNVLHLDVDIAVLRQDVSLPGGHNDVTRRLRHVDALSCAYNMYEGNI